MLTFADSFLSRVAHKICNFVLERGDFCVYNLCASLVGRKRQRQRETGRDTHIIIISHWLCVRLKICQAFCIRSKASRLSRRRRRRRRLSRPVQSNEMVSTMFDIFQHFNKLLSNQGGSVRRTHVLLLLLLPILLQKYALHIYTYEDKLVRRFFIFGATYFNATRRGCCCRCCCCRSRVLVSC